MVKVCFLCEALIFLLVIPHLSGKFVITIPKKNKGEYFPNLNMVTELLKPSGKVSAEPVVVEMEAFESGLQG